MKPARETRNDEHIFSYLCDRKQDGIPLQLLTTVETVGGYAVATYMAYMYSALP